MSTLVPKLVLTPLLVASTSLAGRRWGPALSGWLVALPLTSGPIAFFIAIEVGPNVAREAAEGALLGAIAQVAFAAAYALAARRGSWLPSVALATMAFFAVGFAVPPLAPGLAFAILLVVVAPFVAVSRGRSAGAFDVPAMPWWDIPARVVIATALVVLISAAAPMIGGRMSGILATFPVYATVLATFAHVTRGPHESTEVLRGLATGLVAFGAFFLALGATLGRLGTAESFLIALVIGLAIQAATLPLLRRAEPGVTGPTA